MNKFQLTINKSFFILIYTLCVLFFLSGLYVKEVSSLAVIGFFFASIYLILCISEKRTVVFYKQGLHFHDLLGCSHYVPVESINHIKVRTMMGMTFTQVVLTDKTVNFIAFKPDEEKLDYIKSIGYVVY